MRQSGGWLRTRYIGEALRDAGWAVEWLRPPGRSVLQMRDTKRAAQPPVLLVERISIEESD